jgi:transcriptional regulator with XRE-family HTH domain
MDAFYSPYHGGIMSRVGDEIKRLREEKGMTHKQLAKQVGAAENFILDVEAGRRVVNDSLITRLSKVLGKDIGSASLMEPESFRSEKSQAPAGFPAQTPIPRTAYTPMEKRSEAFAGNVKDVWNDALSSVLKPVPVYDQSMKKILSHRQLPIINGKVEEYPKDKVCFLKIETDEMSGLRLMPDDLVFACQTQEFEEEGVYLVEAAQRRVLRQLKKTQGNQYMLSHHQATTTKEELPKAQVQILARLLRVEFTLGMK